MYPELPELRKLEKRTLKCIAEMGEFSYLSALQAAAKASLNRINEYRGSVNIHLGFTLDIRLRADRRAKLLPRRVDVGALVQATQDDRVQNASYSLVICRDDNPSTAPIVRKVHFDYEPIRFRNAGEQKPTLHMQICGKFSPHHIAAGYKSVRLDSWYPDFEKPRIPLPPTSIALMLNWLLMEFQSDAASPRILNSPTWRTLVAEAERVVLLPYYEQAITFFRSAANNNKRFLQTHLYETAGG